MVIVETCTDDIRNKTAEFYQQFDVVCAFDLNLSTILNIADICHKNNISLFVGDVFGYYGGFLADLGNHEYAELVKINYLMKLFNTCVLIYCCGHISVLM